MKKTLLVSLLFVVAAAYDGLLGGGFLLAAGAIFDRVGVTPPNHLGYVHFPAALLIVFAVMFLTVAVKPRANRGLIVYGIMLKIAYCGVVGYHWAAMGVPDIWKPFVVIDMVFLVLFVIAYAALRAQPSGENAG